MKRCFILTAMLCTAALAFSQAALSGTYRYSTSGYITFTNGRFEGRWNAQTPISGTYAVSGTRLTLTITGGPRAGNTWAWTIADANTLRDQDGDRWSKEGSAQAPAQGATAPVSATFNVSSPSNWIEAVNGIREGGNNKNYVINVSGAVAVIPTQGDQNTFGSVTGLTVTMQGEGELSPNTAGYLLIVGAGHTIIAKDVVLKGRSNNGGASVVVIRQNGTFRMEGNASITGNTARTGGGVHVYGGNFVMQGGTISGNTILENYGGSGSGVYVESGTFNMNGGTISGNSAPGGGGGVHVYGNGGSFVMQGGTISGNIGGGVFVDSYRTFTMSGGIISENTGYGVYVSGTFTMQNGTISGNTAERNGSGVCVSSSGTFTMQNGTISGNTAGQNGGGVYVSSFRTFTMSGGTISGNTAGQNGGGVYVVNSGTFTMSGGTISGNTANGRDGGGGVYNDGTFTMQNGTISGNTATGNGGGVFGNLTKTGGTIHGSDAEQGLRNTAGQRGHVVFNNNQWRSATAGPNMNTATFGFWMND